MTEPLDRRQALKIIVSIGGVATAIMLPGKWTKPIVQSIVVPAHARASVIGSPPVSDVRLKRDVVRVGQLPNGLPLYRFRYLWSDMVYVGLMAQDVQRIAPEAVVRGEDGVTRVHYGRLGTRMMTWDEWQQQEAARHSRGGRDWFRPVVSAFRSRTDFS